MHLTNRFFSLFGLLAALFALSYPFPWLLAVSKGLFFAVWALVLADVILLYRRRMPATGLRTINHILSLSDPNPVQLTLENQTGMVLSAEVYDELPVQLQQRHFLWKCTLPANASATHQYEVRPFTRGAYLFGHINVLLSSRLGLVQRRIRAGAPVEVQVYPSILQMKRYELRAMQQIAHDTGIRRLRRIGHSYEFDQIKNYVEGDDYRSINWKASGRRNTLMVNQYEDERSQQVYCIVDKSRAMKLPFGGLSLMDYAINASLALSNIILKKKDKAGLLSFSDVMGSTLKAERDTGQLQRILEALYREKERPGESNYELLYEAVRRLVGGRSMLLLFTNFESSYALERVLPALRRLNGAHLLVVIFFENTEVKDITRQPVHQISDIYRQVVASQFIQEKKEMVSRLRQYGIQSVLTRPEDLTVNTINKYLELKSRGLI